MAKDVIVCPNCEFKLTKWQPSCPICGQAIEPPADMPLVMEDQAVSESVELEIDLQNTAEQEKIRQAINKARAGYDYKRTQELLDQAPPGFPERSVIQEWINLERSRVEELRAAQEKGDRLQLIRLLQATPNDYPNRNRLIQQMVDAIHLQLQNLLRQAAQEETYREALRKADEAISLVGNAKVTQRLAQIRGEIDQRLSALQKARTEYDEVEQALQTGNTQRAIFLLENLVKRYPERKDYKSKLDELKTSAQTIQPITGVDEWSAAQQTSIAATGAKPQKDKTPLTGLQPVRQPREGRRLYWTIGAILAIIGLAAIVVILTGWLSGKGGPAATATAGQAALPTAMEQVVTEAQLPAPTDTLVVTDTLAASDTAVPTDTRAPTNTPTEKPTPKPTWTSVIAQSLTHTALPTLTPTLTPTPSWSSPPATSTATVKITFPTNTVAVKPTKPPAKPPTKPPAPKPTAFVPPTPTKTAFVP